MVRRRRTPTKSRKGRSKGIKLSSEYWLRNSKDIQKYREQALSEQGGVCAVSGVPLVTAASTTVIWADQVAMVR